MPPIYVAAHLLAGTLLFYLMLKTPRRTTRTTTIALSTMALVGLGLSIERRSDWAWQVMRWSITDLVFLTNLTLEGSAVLFALVWKAAPAKRDRLRAGLLWTPLAGVALWSYAWYFGPAPADVNGQIDATGLCRQSSDETCSAAAAVTLLHWNGIETSERRLTGLCLTRAGQGTTPLGLYRGLAIAAAPHALRPHFEQVGPPDRLQFARLPAIIGVGLRSGTPPEVASRMQGYGWSYSVRHSVVVLGAEPDGKWLDVADPSNGRERWPSDDLKYLWDGTALTLVRR